MIVSFPRTTTDTGVYFWHGPKSKFLVACRLKSLLKIFSSSGADPRSSVRGTLKCIPCTWAFEERVFPAVPDVFGPYEATELVSVAQVQWGSVSSDPFCTKRHVHREQRRAVTRKRSVRKAVGMENFIQQNCRFDGVGACGATGYPARGPGPHGRRRVAASARGAGGA